MKQGIMLGKNHGDLVVNISEETKALIRASFAENTIINRKNALEKFEEWLEGRPFSDQILADHISYLFSEGKAPGTISIVVSAMKWVLKTRNNGADVPLPITTATMAGIRREGRDRGRGQRNGLTWREVEKICAVQEADGTLRGMRNSTIIRVMSDAMLRVSEAAELRVDDIQENMIRVRFSKTDQEGQGAYLYLCEDTRKVLNKYLERTGLKEGRLFRRVAARGDGLYHDRKTGEIPALTRCCIRLVIQRCAARVGITEKISGHSPRIGSAISLAQAGATVVDMQEAGRWDNPDMPAYYARAQLSEQSPMARFKDEK